MPTLKLKRAWPRAMASRCSAWPAQPSNKWKTSCLIGFGARFSPTVNGTVERNRAPPFAPSMLTEPAAVSVSCDVKSEELEVDDGGSARRR